MLEHLEFPYPEVTQYLQYCVDDAANARGTIEAKIKSFRPFCDFMQNSLRITSIQQINSAELQAWMNHLMDLDYARQTMLLHISHVFSMWRWCIAKGFIEEQEAPLLRKSSFKFKGRPPKVRTILTPEAIFKIRTAGYGTLAAACIFEVALCTGMRVGEILQLRASDIEWGKVPNDKEMDSPSPYCMASILIYPARHAIKVRKHKRIYLSRMACKMLIMWLEDRRIPVASNLPIFPHNKKGAWAILNGLAKKCGAKATALEVHLDKEEQYDVDEMYGFADVSLNEVEDDLLKAMIVRARKQESKKRKLLRMGFVGARKYEKEATPRKSALNPHTMRYTNITLMWYRTFTGERQNDLAIKMTTGHSVTKQMRHYMLENDVVKNDYIWRAVWLGKPDHWLHLKVATKIDKARGSGHMQGYIHKWGKSKTKPETKQDFPEESK